MQSCSVKKQAPILTEAIRKMGVRAYVREAFGAARKANPNATLLINDYRVDPAYGALIEKLVDADGKRIYDVIGIQSHMHGGPWPNRKIWQVCERFAKFGVPLHFTETTIISGKKGFRLADKSRKPWPSTEEGEAFQAREVERFYTMLFSHPAVEAHEAPMSTGPPAIFVSPKLQVPESNRAAGHMKASWAPAAPAITKPRTGQ